jgi:outer membrane lipoprotein LolB
MRRFVPLALSAMLAACAATPRVAPVAGAMVDPARVVDWSARGRMAIAFANEGVSGTFEWEQHAATTSLQVRGPLGAGALRIVTDGEALSVTDADGRALDGAAAQSQIRSRLGADLPIPALRFWLLGLAAPGSTAQVSADGPRPARSIEQAGWIVRYDPFTAVHGWSVPTRLTAAGGGARIKVIVDDWQLPAAGSTEAGRP